MLICVKFVLTKKIALGFVCFFRSAVTIKHDLCLYHLYHSLHIVCHFVTTSLCSARDVFLECFANEFCSYCNDSVIL